MAMAGYGYHSPQFSEDIVWLPPWLQPLQVPPFGDRVRDEQGVSPLACKNVAPLEEEAIHRGQHGQFPRDHATFSGCHLHLSGDDETPAGSTLSSGNALHFHLHLSSVGVSEPSAGQINDIPQTEKHENNEDSSNKPDPETPSIQKQKICQHTVEDGAPIHDMLPVSCEPRMSIKPIIEPLSKTEQNNQQRFRGKLDGCNLRNADIIQKQKICQHTVEDGAPIHDMLPVSCEPRMSIKPIIEPLSKTEQNNQQRFRGKFNAGNLRNADINDAIELSIAASEAMVISDLVSGCCQSELLKAKTILEIALCVKHARNQCCLDIEDGPASSDELDETDELCDLDESFLADAFDDVGLSITQLVNSADNSSHGRKYAGNFCSSDIKQQTNLQSSRPCEENTHVSESLFDDKEETQSKKLKAQDVDATETNAQIYGAIAIKSKNLPLKSHTVQQKKPSVYLSSDSMTSGLKNQSIALVQDSQNADALAAYHMSPEKGQAILKVGEVKIQGNASNRKNITGLFNGATSFISESMDDIGDHPIEQRIEAEPEIIGSSSTPYANLPRFACKENEIAPEELVRSSSLSFVDPLCSVVPCSISSDNAFIIYDSNQKKTEEGKKFMSSSTAVGEQILNVKPTEPNFQETLSPTPLAQAEECDLPKNPAKDFGMPSYKKVSSLGPYSMIMPTLNTSKKMVFHDDSVSFLNMDGKIKNLIHTERNTHCVVLDGDDSSVPLKCSDKRVDVGGPKNSNVLGSKVQECVDQLFPLPETQHDDYGILRDKHEKGSSPIVLNKKKHRLWAYNITFNGDDEDGSLKRFSASKKRRYKSKECMSDVIYKDQTSDVICKDQTNSTSHAPLQRSIRLRTPNKQGLQNKRVSFLEAKHDIDSPKTRGRLPSRYRLKSSHHRTNKRANNSSLQHKSGTTKSYNHQASCHEVYGEEMIFQGLEFLLTGFSSQKRKELEALIRKYGGYVLSDIPACSPDLRGRWMVEPACWKLPIILSPKKVQTTKFLYGCAINTWTLNANWIVDAVQAGCALPPGKYLTRPVQLPAGDGLRIGKPLCFNDHSIFDRLGIMLYGKVSFSTKFSKIIKHGGGQVFESLQRLVQSLNDGKNNLGAILVENEACVSRHLKHCASEHNLQTMPASWIVNSLFSGKLLPFKKDRYAPLHKIKMPKFPQDQAADMSQEI